MKKKEIILYIFDCLSNIEFQQQVWVNGEKFDMYCSSFGEAVNSLDDFNFFDDVENGMVQLKNSDDQNKLKKILDDLSNFEEPASIDEMLKSPAWIKIVEESRQIRRLLSDLEW